MSTEPTPVRPSATTAPFSLGPSILFCPGDRPERYAKAAERADAVILDLEDAVAPADKPEAREHLARHLADLNGDSALLERTIVRVNPAGAETREELAADLQVLEATGVRHVMLAKTESPDDVDDVVRALGPRVGIIALCETPAGITRAEQIAAHPSVTALMWGAEDLVAALGGSSSRHATGAYRDVARTARSLVLLTAATHGKAGIDTIYADLTDLDGLSAEAEDAAASGFAAKACIHPSHVAPIRAAYAPTDAQLEHATALLAEVPQHAGSFRFRGAMVDAPLIRHAERIVQRATRTSAHATRSAGSTPAEGETP